MAWVQMSVATVQFNFNESVPMRLIEDSEARILAETRTGELENKLYVEQERRVEQEYDAMSKIVELEKQVAVFQSELDKIRSLDRPIKIYPLYFTPSIFLDTRPIILDFWTTSKKNFPNFFSKNFFCPKIP